MKKLATLVLAALALALVCAPAMAKDWQSIRIATEGAYPPFNYMDEEGNPQGFDVDIAKALCEEMQVHCELVIQDWDGIIPGLLAKKYDAIIASMSITDERKKVVDFTNKYYMTPARFVTKKGEDVEISKEGLKGKTIGVQRGVVAANFLQDNFADVAEIKTYATQEEANMDLIAGRVDLVMADSVVLLGGLLENPDIPEGKNYEFVGPGFTDPQWFGDGIGIAVRKEDDKLKEMFNQAIKDIREDGTYQQINAKYFDFDVYGD
jgi:arginine/ornithine transport system substrate-binding protein